MESQQPSPSTFNFFGLLPDSTQKEEQEPAQSVDDDNEVKITDLEDSSVAASSACRTSLFLASRRTLPIAPSAILCLKLISATNQAVAGCKDGNMVVYDLSQNGFLVDVYAAHTKALNILAISIDCNHMLSGGDDQVVVLWNIGDMSKLHTFTRAHEGSVVGLAFVGTSYISTACTTGNVILWCAKTWDQVLSFQACADGLLAIDLSVDNSTMATSSRDGKVALWSIPSCDKINELTGHNGGVGSVKFSIDGSKLVTGSHDSTAALWEVNTGKMIRLFRGYHRAMVSSVDISSDGCRVVTGSYDRSITIWDAYTALPLRHLKGHDSSVSAVAFNSDATQIISVSLDRHLVIWDDSVGEQSVALLGHNRAITSIAFSEDENMLVTTSEDRTAIVWNAHTGSRIYTFRAHREAVQAVACMKNLAITCGNDSLVIIWDLRTGKKIRTLEGHKDAVLCISISSAHNLIATSGDDATVILWDAQYGTIKATLKAHTRSVTAIGLLPDTKRLISASRDSSLFWWDVAANTVLRRFSGATDDIILCIAISPSGVHFATGGQEKTVNIWETESGLLVKKLAGHKDTVISVAYSKDNDRLVSGSIDRSSVLWDMTCQKIRRFKNHETHVTAVAVSKDCLRVVSGTRNGAAGILYQPYDDGWRSVSDKTRIATSEFVLSTFHTCLQRSRHHISDPWDLVPFYDSSMLTEVLLRDSENAGEGYIYYNILHVAVQDDNAHTFLRRCLDVAPHAMLFHRNYDESLSVPRDVNSVELKRIPSANSISSTQDPVSLYQTFSRFSYDGMTTV